MDPVSRSVAVATRIAVTFGAGAPFIIFLYGAIRMYKPEIFDSKNRPRDTHVFRDKYDFIIIGAGSAGAVLANRLTEVSSWNVLLLEAGGPEPSLSDIPAFMPALQHSVFDWNYKTEYTGDACLAMHHGQCNWPRGKCLGGSSVLNAMLYIRGNQRDYDQWLQLGNPGWSYTDVLPYFIKSEDCRIPKLSNSKYHGKGGYLTVEEFKYKTPIVKDFLEAAKELGYKIRDVNGRKQTGFMKSQATLRNGLRCSTAKAFLRPIKDRPNLHISMFSHVEKLLVEPGPDGTAVCRGVVFKKLGRRYEMLADKEVILSAGSINSPQIMMLSGLGPREHLESLGIYVVKDIAGVGQNLQDHISLAGTTFLVDNPITYVLPRLLNIDTAHKFIAHTDGPLMTFAGSEVMAFIDTAIDPSRNVTDFSDVHQDWPDIQLFIGSFADSTDGGIFGKKANGISDEFYAAVFEPIIYKDAFSATILLLRPHSRGSVTLRSNSPYDPPILRPQYFTDRRDIDTLVAGARFVMKYSETYALKRHGSRINPNKIPACEIHEFLSYDYWECAIRHYSLTIYHPVGTAKMGPSSDPMAVLDSELRVHGVDGLRVIDASMMPNIVSGNTNAPVIMIGEKGADMIKAHWLSPADHNWDQASGASSPADHNRDQASEASSPADHNRDQASEASSPADHNRDQASEASSPADHNRDQAGEASSVDWNSDRERDYFV